MSDPDRDQSIENEPHLRASFHVPDASEERADRVFSAARATEEDAVEHTVWDEPALMSWAGSPPEDQLTYGRWLQRKIAETSSLKTWLTTLAVVLIAGPFGILGALMGGDGSMSGLLMVTVVGPVTEEITKIAAALWVVERRPYLFKSIPQILLCAVAGGLAFAFIENLMYLNVYIPHHTPKLAAWRWTVCVGLHSGCSFVAGVGLARIWDNAVRELHRPQMGLGMPWFFTAMLGHGLYNGAVTVAETLNLLEL